MLLTNSFEGGTDGVVITTGNSGGASGTAWDFVSAGAGITKEFDSAQKFAGTLSGLVATGASSVTALFQWAAAIGTPKAEVWGRFYFRLGALPATNFNLLNFFDGATQNGRIRFNSTGKMSVTDTSFAVAGTSTTTFSANTWYKIEYRFKFSTTVGECDVLIYTDPNSSTPAETLSYSGRNFGSSQTDTMSIGHVSTATNLPNLWLDDIQLNDTGFPGVVAKSGSDTATGTSSSGTVSGSLDLNNGFEGGTDGTTISTGNSGGASGNAWDFVQLGTNATVVYDTTVVKNGAVSGEISTGADDVTAHLLWDSKIGTKAQLYGRVYFRISGLPAENINILDFANGATSLVRLRLNTTGTITITDFAFATVATTSTTFSAGTWYRIELRFGFGVSTGSCELRVYTSADSGTAAETIGPLTGKSFGAATASAFRVGHISPKASLPTIWLDDININDNAFPGPVASTSKSSSDTATATDSASVAAASVTAPAMGVHAWYEAEGLSFAASYDRFNSQCAVDMDHYHGYHNPIPTSVAAAYGMSIPAARPPLNSEQNMKTDWLTNPDPASHVNNLNTLLNDLETNYPNMKVTFTFNHEPENDTAPPATQFGTAVTQAGNWCTHFLALARAVWARDNPNFKVSMTLQGYTSQRRVSNNQRISPWLPVQYWNPAFTPTEQAKVIVCSDTYPILNSTGNIVANKGDLDMRMPAQTYLFDDMSALGYTLFGFSEFAINCDDFVNSFAFEDKVRDYIRGFRNDLTPVIGSLGHFLRTTPYKIVHFSYYERSFITPDNVSGRWHWLAISPERISGWETLVTDLRAAAAPPVVNIFSADATFGTAGVGSVNSSAAAAPSEPLIASGPGGASGISQRYTYTCIDFLTNQTLIEIPMFGVQFGRKLSDVGYFQGLFKLDATGFDNQHIMEATIPGRTVLCVRRGGVPIWAGPITSRSYASDAKNVTLSAATFEYVLERRRLDADYVRNETDQLSMFYELWALMQSSPGSDYGIKPPPVLPTCGVLKSLTGRVLEDKKYRALIDEIAVADNGFDWLVDIVDVDGSLQKSLRTGFPEIGSPFTETVFEYPGNIINYYYTERISDGATHLKVVGEGDSTDAIFSLVTQTDLITGGFPRYDDDVQVKRISSQSSLDERAVVEGRKRRPPVSVVKVFLFGDEDPEFGSWALGDRVRLVIKDPRFPQALQLPNARPVAWTLTPASSSSIELVDITFEGEDIA